MWIICIKDFIALCSQKQNKTKTKYNQTYDFAAQKKTTSALEIKLLISYSIFQIVHILLFKYCLMAASKY